MRIRMYRWRYWALTLTAGTLAAFNGCGLTDQQLASIWQSVLATGLNTVVTNALTTAFGLSATA